MRFQRMVWPQDTLHEHCWRRELGGTHFRLDRDLHLVAPGIDGGTGRIDGGSGRPVYIYIVYIDSQNIGRSAVILSIGGCVYLCIYIYISSQTHLFELLSPICGAPWDPGNMRERNSETTNPTRNLVEPP